MGGSVRKTAVLETEQKKAHYIAEAGIEKALEKRPIPQDKINKMISAIDEQIRKAGKKEVKSSVIGELVMKKLKKLDDVAYVRFASVYRQFQDINDFKQEVNEL